MQLSTTNKALRWLSAMALLMSTALSSSTWAAQQEDGEDPRPEVVLWHAYRAEEAKALEVWAQQVNTTEKRYRIKVLGVPYDAFLDKITAAIPRGKGPDVFIAAHDSIGDWAEAGTIAPVESQVDPGFLSRFHDGLIPALLYERRTEEKPVDKDDKHAEVITNLRKLLPTSKGGPSLYGIPLAFKSIALWRNTKLAPNAPSTWSELLDVAKAKTGDGTYGLVYENRDLYYHVGLLHAFGGALFDDNERPTVNTPAFARSLKFTMSLGSEHKVLPQEVSGTLVSGLFNQNKAAYIITGPWAWGDIDQKAVDFAVSPLPKVDVAVDGEKPAGDARMKPFLTVEAAMVSGRSRHPALAVDVAKRLAAGDASPIRLLQGLQPVALKETWALLDKRVAEGGFDRQANFLRAFREQLPATVPTPNTPAMKSMWGPVGLAMGETLGQGTEPSKTLAVAQKQLESQLKEVARSNDDVDPTSFYAVITLLGLMLIAWMLLKMKQQGGAKQLASDVVEQKAAYAYAAPAMIGMLVLVFVPFALGVGMGFFKHTWGNYSFVGLRNFVSILAGSDSRFVYTLGMTVLWTASNVFLHVAIGVFLALVLSQARLKYRTVYRVLFIIPWAVPNYITALIWKGMFHPEFGAINALLGTDGFSWMNHTWSAFVANLATNTWLGFPFMMVTALGGLTAIPKDLYEAAELDGAGPLSRFWNITLPLLKPTLAPAIVLGTVWTFNMFNVIYLVSGGAPGGSTDILITEAFRWAFERGQGGAFGYAASYSTLIFLMLLSYNWASQRVTKAIEEGAS